MNSVHQEDKGENKESYEEGRDNFFDDVAVKKLEHAVKYNIEKA